MVFFVISTGFFLIKNYVFNNKVCIQWATKLWDDNTTTNITLKVSYTSFYIIIGFQWGTNGGNAYKNGYCLVSKNLTSFVARNNTNADDNTWMYMTIGY